MEDKKKKFIIPEAEIIDFTNNDIITSSDGSDWPTEAPDGEDCPTF